MTDSISTGASGHSFEPLLPEILSIMDPENMRRSFVEDIPDTRLLIKAITSVMAELNQRKISYSPAPEEVTMLRALFRRPYNLAVKLGLNYSSVDDLIEVWLKTGMPIYEWTRTV